MRFSIFGAKGYIGSQLALWLESRGVEVLRFVKGDESWRDTPLGYVVYAAGLTADFRERPELCVEAHAGLLAQILSEGDFDALTYCSSTRLYGLKSATAMAEESQVSMEPGLDAVYNSSKLLGESLCLSWKDPNVRVVRLSNVFGPEQPANSFLSQVVASLKQTACVEIGEARTSEKDYIFISDVIELLYSITTNGQHRLYNLASGHGTSHRQLATLLEKAGFSVAFAEGGPERKLAQIDTSRIKNEFAFQATPVAEGLKSTLSGKEQGE